MTEFLWTRQSQCFYVYHDEEEKSKAKPIRIKNYPNGIFASLFDELKGSPVGKGVIQIIRNSSNDSEEKLLPKIVDPSFDNNHWVSQKYENSHISIDFKGKLIKFSKYRLIIGNRSGDWLFKNWTLNEQQKKIVKFYEKTCNYCVV